MSKWIDADALHNALKAKQKWIVRCGDKHNEGYTYDQVHFAIDDAPSIDIVRCKECKHFKQGVRFNKPRYTDIENFCAYHMVFDWNANSFCSCGERIDDE